MIEKITLPVKIKGPSVDTKSGFDPGDCIFKINELIDAVNDLEETVYEGPDDATEGLDDDRDDDDDDRAWEETEPFVERLHHLSTGQLEHLLEEAEWILEGRHRQGQEYVCPECRAKADQPREIDTTDGWFGEFAAYAAVHPELRFFQAVRNWSGYNFIFGSMSKNVDDYSQLEDTFNLTTKGPKKGSQPVHGNA